jgi:hypothetical protein
MTPMELREVYWEIEVRVVFVGRCGDCWTRVAVAAGKSSRFDCEEDAREGFHELREQGRDVRLVKVVREVVEPEGNSK